ncbi:ABC-type transport auxiliary lipoprotein family protein [Azotobacter beijerinckii]|uniref:ABC-type transport auxiliary lipoprotein family protein n=1 Tax=Azotobacter beijerinckii TaxID=170623 RepID=UPI002955494D|nr:ABC-type transport auxiliary lipoprotein family protein [Azotobacter beijerinckii]MDV7213114.1 ABC-type transport auxiliary lipoprotein family protein [Azotobacter beijerinckii]
MNRQPLRPLALLLLLGNLTACSVLPEAEQIHVYRLPGSPLQAQTATARLDQALCIATPKADRMLGSARIAVVPEGNRISGYQGARWSDDAPTLLRDRLIEAFREDGRTASVSSDDNHLHTDLELLGDLRAFHAEYVGGKPQVRVSLDVSLVHSASQRVLASRRFEVRQSAGDERLDSVVAAFGAAGDHLSRQLVDWTLAQGGRLAGR